MYLNKTQIIGNLTRDPEVKALPSGDSVISFGVATNRSYKVEGVKKEEVEFHNVVAFGKVADVIKQYCHKGDQIYVEGRLKTSNWDKDGVKHYKTEIIMENFQFGNKSKLKDDETGEVIPDNIGYKSLDEVTSADPETGKEIDMSSIPF